MQIVRIIDLYNVDNQLTAVAMESLRQLVESNACPKLQAVSLNCIFFIFLVICSK